MIQIQWFLEEPIHCSDGPIIKHKILQSPQNHIAQLENPIQRKMILGKKKVLWEKTGVPEGNPHANSMHSEQTLM